MKSQRSYIYGTLAAIPFLALTYYLNNPPQCPENYTQEQINNSNCIVGTNIGGMPVFLLSIPIIWLAAVWVVGKLLNKTKKK